MAPSLRTLLLGRGRDRFRLALDFLLVALVFAASFGAYALGLFAVAGGVVFLPGDAAILGLATAAGFAFQGAGFVQAWLTGYAALLGSTADHYLLGLSGRSLGERVGAFLSPDGLVYLAVVAVVLGTVAWLAGAGFRLGLDAVRADGTATDT